MATHENNSAMRAMSSFIDSNLRAIRRLSKLPPVPLTFEQLQAAVEQQEGLSMRRPPTPPSSNGLNTSPSFKGLASPPGGEHHASSLERLMASQNGRTLHTREMSGNSVGSGTSSHHGIRSPPTPPLDATTALSAMMGKLNVRGRGNSVPPSPALSATSASDRMRPIRSMSIRSVPLPIVVSPQQAQAMRLSTNSLRTFRLGTERPAAVKVAPTF